MAESPDEGQLCSAQRGADAAAWPAWTAGDQDGLAAATAVGDVVAFFVVVVLVALGRRATGPAFDASDKTPRPISAAPIGAPPSSHLDRFTERPDRTPPPGRTSRR